MKDWIFESYKKGGIMHDFTDYELRDLFKIRDALAILKGYDLCDDDLMYSINNELETRKDLANI